ncbi:DNA ligase [Pseudohyphozyma bogoriensis]|nr:DNA ligase [Pseudohyphozyma bogoriensis]
MPKFWSQGTHAKRPRPTDETDNPAPTPTPYQSVPDDVPKPAGIENRVSPPFSLLTDMLKGFEEASRKKAAKPGSKTEELRKFFIRDTRRRTYHLKEQKLAKAYVLALDLPPTSADALKLTNWKVPTAEDRAAGEFSTVAYDVIATRSTVTTAHGDMTVDEVNAALDKLSVAGANVRSDGQKRPIGQEHARILKECFQRMTATELKWMTRIILRDLKIGLGERGVFAAMHPDAMEFFNTCSDILRVCWKLYDPNMRLPQEDQFVKPGSVFRPMLCQRNARNLNDIVKKMKQGRPRDDGKQEERSREDPFYYANNEFILEEKLDGERIQLHKIGNTFQYHSRKAQNYTHLYGANANEGSLTPFIADLFNSELEETILDGEMLVWDPELNKHVPFGTLKTFASKCQFGPFDPRPCFKVFDILFIKTNRGEKNLIGQSLSERRKILHKLVQQKPGVLEITTVFKASLSEHISDHLRKILEARGEGLVIKNPSSKYILGGRESTWIKVKPDYMDELGETVDAVVVGGYWGQGNRAGRHSSFMVGLRNDDLPYVNGQPVFMSFAKVGSGFNLEAYNTIKETTKGKWIDFDRKKPSTIPAWFKTVSEYPDQLIAPSDSFVVTIKAAEIVGGAEYGAGMTLRFPRAQRMRTDMDMLEAMDIDQVRGFRTTGTKRSFGNDLRGKNKKTKRAPGAKALYISAPVVGLVSKGDLFKGMKFYVHKLTPNKNDKTPLDKPDLEILIEEHGGDYSQRIPERSPSSMVVADEFTGIKSKKGAKESDIVSPQWVLESIKARRKLPLYKRFYVRALPETEQSIDYNRDEEEDKKLAPELDVKEEIKDEEMEPKEEEEDDEDDEDEVMPPASSYRSGFTPRDVKNEDSDGGGGTTSEDEIPEPDTEDDEVEVIQEEEESKVAPVEELEDVKLEDVDPEALTDAKPGMGAGQGALEYDPDKPFEHFLCYFDTSANAVENELIVSKEPSKTQESADKMLKRAEEELLDNFGHVTTNLRDPKLTHIIVHKKVADRYAQMINLTSEIRDSVDGGEGALDEGDYKP